MTTPETHPNACLKAALCAGLLALLAVAFAPRAEAARPLDIGFSDARFEQAGNESQQAFERATDLHADIIRVNMYWAVVGFNQPTNPTDPDDPNYDWSLYDNAIRGAAADGFDIDLTVTNAPAWAEGPNRPSDLDRYPAGSWKPNAQAFADFARAVATRYSGSFTPAGELEPLPAVKYFEAWNEPNLSTYITPQWDGNKNMATDIYGKMLNGFYDSVKAVSPDAQVVVGGTAPYGDPPGGPNRTQPIRFYQELLCLNTKNKKSSCPNGEAPKFDVIAHHPINRTDPPKAKAANKGDVEVADFGSLVDVLRAAERQGTPATGGKHDVWANEIWWQTNPPDKAEGVSYKTQARWYQQTFQMLWKAGADNVTLLQLQDSKYTPGEFTLASYQSGVFTYAGKRKPSADAVAFPFVVTGKGKKAKAWGEAPAAGRLTVKAKAKGGGYRKVGSFDVKSGAVFNKSIRLPKAKGKVKLRASVGGEQSLVWTYK
ncbi:MAG: hypothetical protein U0R24_07210 [Solirubrobacterales bacterium]